MEQFAPWVMAGLAVGGLVWTLSGRLTKIEADLKQVLEWIRKQEEKASAALPRRRGRR